MDFQVGGVNPVSPIVSTGVERSVAANQYKTQDKAELMEACREFETYFINEMFKSMRKTVSAFSPEKKSPMESTFSDFLDEEYSKIMSAGRGMGLSMFLYKQLSRDKSENLGMDEN